MSYSLEKTLLREITNEAERRGNEFQQYHNYLHIEYLRKKRRLLKVKPKHIKKPKEWEKNRLYNPFYVKKNADKIARSIAKKIKNNNYIPVKPIRDNITKSGKNRDVSLFQLPDSAVSYFFYKNLLKKNKHRFSSFAYAYRDDRNVHYAIQDIANELRGQARVFIAEFDFSKFFQSIDHDYIYAQLESNSFLISKLEKQIIKNFLSHEGGKGIPLGTSLSLFIANLVCWNLDRRLEDEGLRFARYADDTIIWSKDYGKICKALGIITEFSSLSGVSINFKKSHGISVIQHKGLRSEFISPKNHIDFLGYSVSVDKISIKDKSVENIKRQISYLLYKSLLQPIVKHPSIAKSLTSEDMFNDFMSAIQQIRRYLYGDLTEIMLRNYLNGTYSKLKFKGVMSFYPLIDDKEQMECLDNWLIYIILNVIKKRGKILEKARNVNYSVHEFPFYCDSKNIISYCRDYSFKNKKGLLQIPSFTRIFRAMQIGIKNEGIESVMNSKSNYYE